MQTDSNVFQNEFMPRSLVKLFRNSCLLQGETVIKILNHNMAIIIAHPQFLLTIILMQTDRPNQASYENI